MKCSALVGSLTACFCLGVATPLLAAPLSPANDSVSAKSAEVTKPAEKCLGDLHAVDVLMEKDGYWLGGSGYGYGYPIRGYGFGYPTGGYSPTIANGYQNARPGYEVRMLVASAKILAQHGQQQPCEDVLATTRGIYKLYVADMHNRGVPKADVPGWRQRQIADAQPITGKTTSFRSDELLGTEVRSPQDEALGSVDDLVMSPQTGAIAYLVIARGGIFGIDEKYVPIPWQDFKITPNVNLLVLDATKDALDTAPQVSDDHFATAGHFDQESQKVDAYWKSQLSKKGAH
jgi:sporulation protein YlmC with PRC-barrel domain